MFIKERHNDRTTVASGVLLILVDNDECVPIIWPVNVHFTETIKIKENNVPKNNVSTN